MPQDLWTKTQERLTAIAKDYIRNNDGTMWGRPGSGAESKYLLTGLGRCATCGGNITMIGGSNGSAGRRKPAYYYGCSCHQNRGSTICANNHRADMEETNAAILAGIERSILTPEAIDYVVDMAVRLITEQQAQTKDLPERLEAEIRKNERKLENFMTVIAEGKAPASVLTAIRELETKIHGKQVELQRLTMAQPNELDQRRMKKQLREQIGQFKTLIYSDVARARQALRKLLDGPIAFAPVVIEGKKGYELTWNTKAAALLDKNYIAVASPRGEKADYFTIFTEANNRASELFPTIKTALNLLVTRTVTPPFKILIMNCIRELKFSRILNNVCASS